MTAPRGAPCMLGEKKLAEIRAEVIALLGRQPGNSARAWLQKEIEAAQRDPNRDVEALKMLLAALKRGRPAG